MNEDQTNRVRAAPPAVSGVRCAGAILGPGYLAALQAADFGFGWSGRNDYRFASERALALVRPLRRPERLARLDP